MPTDKELLDWVDRNLATVTTKKGAVHVEESRKDGTLFQCWIYMGDGTFFKSGGTVRDAIAAAMKEMP